MYYRLRYEHDYHILRTCKNYMIKYFDNKTTKHYYFNEYLNKWIEIIKDI